MLGSARQGVVILSIILSPLVAGAQDLGARKVQLDQMRKKLANTDEAAALARAYLSLADDALRANDYELAVGSANSASGVAAKLGDVDLVNYAKGKERESVRLKGEFAKVKEAEGKIANGNDPEARLVIGRFYCFTKEDWATGLPHLAQSSDVNLKGASASELAAKTSNEQGAAAEEWIAASTKLPQQRAAIIDHALQLYRKVWDDASAGIEKEKLRTRLRTLANVPLQPGSAGTPPGWNSSHVSALNRVFIEPNFSHSGRRCLRFDREKETDKGLAIVDSVTYPAKPLKEYTLSLWVWSERNTSERAYVSVRWINSDGGMMAASEIPLTVDVPIWTQLKKSWTCPENAAKVDLQIGVSFKGRCVVFVDDVSLTVEGKEVLQNGSFETTDKK